MTEDHGYPEDFKGRTRAPNGGENMNNESRKKDVEAHSGDWLLKYDDLEQRLESVRDHMKSYPDETDDKYYIERHHPSPAGSHFFNSVLFLTHLETWHKQLEEILEAESL